MEGWDKTKLKSLGLEHNSFWQRFASRNQIQGEERDTKHEILSNRNGHSTSNVTIYYHSKVTITYISIQFVSYTYGSSRLGLKLVFFVFL